jgi:CelD/BcsL family acetyltransferase involved in cellulose biosynthesis
MIDCMSVRTSLSLRASDLTDDLEFDALAPEWDRVLDQSDQRVFFLRWAWNRLWWRLLRPPDSQLFIIACRDEQDTLFGFAPFYLRQRRTAGIPHLRELLFLGTGVYVQTSEYLNIVARQGCERMVADTIVEYLERSDDWDRLCLKEIPATSASLSYLMAALGEDAHVEVCNRSYFVDTTVDWGTFVRGLSNSARDNVVRRTRRLFESHDCRLRRVETADELELAMEALVRLHQARWKSKGEPGSFALPNMEEFLKEAMRQSLSDRRLGFTSFEVDGKIAGARVDFVDNHTAHWFQGGFDPAYAKEGLGSVMNGLCIRACIEDELVDEYDFMGGGAEYKESWTKNHRDSVCISLARKGIRSKAYNGIETAKAIGKSVLRATVPKPIRMAGHRMVIRRHYNQTG